MEQMEGQRKGANHSGRVSWQGSSNSCQSPHLPLTLEVRAQDWGPRSLHNHLKTQGHQQEGSTPRAYKWASRQSPVAGGVFRAGTHPTGRRLSRLRRLRGLKERRILALSAPGHGQESQLGRLPGWMGQGACAGCIFRGQWSPHSVSTCETYLPRGTCCRFVAAPS